MFSLVPCKQAPSQDGKKFGVQSGRMNTKLKNPESEANDAPAPREPLRGQFSLQPHINLGV